MDAELTNTLLNPIVITLLAVISGALQTTGYILYIRQSLKHEIKPHPATWLMFAYGTALLAILEAVRGASWYLLILPISCAVLSIVVAGICWKHGTLKWPKEGTDAAAFILDLILTFCFVIAWILTASGTLSVAAYALANIVFLRGSNLTTLTSFAPLVRETYLNPRSEHPLPWIVWTGAYATLAVLTYFESGLMTELMIYPVMGVLMHGSVAVLSR